MELAGELAVDRVLHDHVQHGAAVIHHELQLPAHVLRPVDTGQLAGQTGGGAGEQIAPGGGGDVQPAGPQQGDVPHNDLPADRKTGRQDGGGDRPGRLGEIDGQRGPALDCVHGGPSSLENLGDI